MARWRALAPTLVVAGVVATFALWRWWADPARVYRADTGWVDATKRKMCALLDADAAAGTTRAPPATPLTSLGRIDLTSDFTSTWNDGNMDVIERSELAWLCDPRGPRSEGRVFHSRFALVAGSSPDEHWDVKAVRHALAALRKIEWVLVVRVDDADKRFRGHATLHHVAEGRVVDAVDFDESATSEKIHTIPSDGRDIATPLNTRWSSSGPFRDLVEKSFAAHGITMTIFF